MTILHVNGSGWQAATSFPTWGRGRIYDGAHYRTSTEVGTAMGKQIGALVAAKYLLPLK
jgi:hypothetical protein